MHGVQAANVDEEFLPFDGEKIILEQARCVRVRRSFEYGRRLNDRRRAFGRIDDFYWLAAFFSNSTFDSLPSAITGRSPSTTFFGVSVAD